MIIAHASPAIAQEVISSIAILSITKYEIVIAETTIAMPHARAQDIAKTIAARSTPVHAPFAGVMAIYKLAALLTVIWPAGAIGPVSAVSPDAVTSPSSVTLPECCRRDGHRQQQPQDNDTQKVLPVLRLLHKSLLRVSPGQDHTSLQLYSRKPV
ncbi:MAG TPA: hypothetical protein DHU55_15695 [Blastocatellia bacterium]|nr:hypothetical protein [Blastocatellia bacterium]